MADRTQEILTQFANALAVDIKEAIPKVTGKTAESVEVRMYDKGFEIAANASVVTLVDGRKPTSSGATAGDPTLYEIILQWIQDAGIRPREENMTEESLAFVISRSIHEKGTRLYQQGGGRNLFQTAITDAKLDLLVASLAENKSIEVSSDIIKQFKQIQ